MILSDAWQRSLNNARFVPIGNHPADPAPAEWFLQSDLEKYPACCLCAADPCGSEGIVPATALRKRDAFAP